MVHRYKGIGFLCHFVLAAGVISFVPRTSRAATFTWTGAGSDNNWGTAANWAGNAVPANDGTAAILLAGSSRLAPVVDSPWDINSLSFSNNAGAFVLGGSVLTIRAGGIV